MFAHHETIFVLQRNSNSQDYYCHVDLCLKHDYLKISQKYLESRSCYLSSKFKPCSVVVFWDFTASRQLCGNSKQRLLAQVLFMSHALTLQVQWRIHVRVQVSLEGSQQQNAVFNANFTILGKIYGSFMYICGRNTGSQNKAGTLTRLDRNPYTCRPIIL